MIEVIDEYKRGGIDLDKVAADLGGLLGASDVRDERLVREFYDHLAPIRMEQHTRMEGFAASTQAADEALGQDLDRFREWVEAVLARTDDSRT
jgi:hypothetical protein